MIIVQTPLRVSFLGGGTDFPDFYEKCGGAVLTTAINKYIYVIVKPRFDSNVRLTYTKAELKKNSNSLKHDIVRECLRHVGITHGIEVITIGDVPSGSGLGSSSAVTVGVLKALYAYIGHETSAKQLAEEACYIEREILCKPIGVQDQYIAAYGGFRMLEFTKNGVVSRKYPIGKLFDHLLMFFTGITRDSAEILGVQSERIKKNREILKEMAGLVYKANWYEDGNFGQLLGENWRLKKKLAGVSNFAIDEWYQKAMNAGATGGKILGAGGGGFLLFYSPVEKKDAIRSALSDLTEIPIAPEPDGCKVILNYRT
jgi:D-glycero-alpha-D-manno-heptose-7-phosphate kinase